MGFWLLCGALSAIWAGCGCFYLASPHQRWRARPWPAGPARGLGVALWLLGLLSLAQLVLPLTAALIWLTCVMLGLALLPYLGVLRQLSGGR